MSAAAHADADVPIGVLLLTFGSAVTSADVPEYLRSVRGGSDASDELITEFRRRFDVIGRSPLIDITLAQAAALEALLSTQHAQGEFVVRAGMLHSTPRVADALREAMDAGARRCIAIVLAPQYSPLILGGYERTLRAVAADTGVAEPRVAGAWHRTAGWIESLSSRLHEALGDLDRARVAVVFTAHSLPRAVMDRDPGYMRQIDETIDAVAARAGLEPADWCFAFQSAGHTPEEWLKPDLLDVLPGLRAAGAEDVLVVPVQFVADHLEVLYDIDVAAAAQARDAGLRFHRIAMPNTDPTFIAALAEVVDRELEPVGT